MAPLHQPWASWALLQHEAPNSDWTSTSMPPIFAQRDTPGLPRGTTRPIPPPARYPQPLKMHLKLDL